MGAIAQLCRAISSQVRHASTIGKKLVKLGGGYPFLWRGGSLPIPHPLETRCLLAPRSAHPPQSTGMAAVGATVRSLSMTAEFLVSLGLLLLLTVNTGESCIL